MTPKKIYTYKEQNNLYVLSESVIAIIQSENATITSHEIYTYILESEHNKQIEELKAENEKLKMERDYCSMVANDLLEDSKWISVEEKMPENSSWVLVYAPTRNMCFMAYNTPNGFQSKFTEIKEGVTHWRKLPNPPQV